MHCRDQNFCKASRRSRGHHSNIICHLVEIYCKIAKCRRTICYIVLTLEGVTYSQRISSPALKPLIGIEWQAVCSLLEYWHQCPLQCRQGRRSLGHPLPEQVLPLPA